MTDISTLIGRLLPFAVIASLLLIFYLLDVFSVPSQFDAEPADVAARQVSPARTEEIPPVRRTDPFPAPTSSIEISPPPPQAAQAQTPVDSVNNFNVESEMPPEREAPQLSPPPAPYGGQQDGLDSEAPRYLPPAVNPGQPPAIDMNSTDMNSTEPVELSSDEILQDESERIESESQQALDEADQAASQAGDGEPEQ